MILIDNRNTTDPYMNLAIEEYLVRHSNCSKDSYLFLYINEPCIVLGKNQSIYREVNFDFLRNEKLKLCRRISGGGTVYQDLGNLNFAFITSFANERLNNYKYFNQLVVDALERVGVKATVDKRNNILYKGKKISGNAQFTDRKNMISHGTLLFDADLDTLRAALKKNDFLIETKAPSSVPSSVTNINAETKGINTTVQLKDFIADFAQPESTMKFTEKQWELITKTAKEKFQTFEWVFGRSPLTKITRGEIVIDVEDGIVSSLSIAHKTEPEFFARQQRFKELVGVRYCAEEMKAVLTGEKEMEQVF